MFFLFLKLDARIGIHFSYFIAVSITFIEYIDLIIIPIIPILFSQNVILGTLKEYPIYFKHISLQNIKLVKLVIMRNLTVLFWINTFIFIGNLIYCIIYGKIRYDVVTFMKVNIFLFFALTLGNAIANSGHYAKSNIFTDYIVKLIFSTMMLIPFFVTIYFTTFYINFLFLLFFILFWYLDIFLSHQKIRNLENYF